MQRVVKKFGGSLGIIIGKYEVALKKINEGDVVEIEIDKIEGDKKKIK